MDLRTFISACESAGELRRVKAEVDWNLEISHVAKLTEEKKGPALLFENVKGHSSPVFTGAFGTEARLALVLGLPAKVSLCEAARQWMKNTITAEGLIKAREVKDGPVLENVHEGAKVDLSMFPVPKFYPLDGGRYIGTAVFLVLRDPETNETNLGTYRMQMLDERSCGVQILPGKRGERILKKYRKLGKKMPAAAVLGCDPLLFMAGTLMHKGASDFDITGTIRGQQQEFLLAPLTGLPVPAGAEIVLEGHIDPENFRAEGPFGEYTGYRTSPRDFRVTFRVNAISFRNDPTMTISNMGVPTDEGQLLRSFSLGLELDKLLRSQGIPITGVYMHPRSTHHMMIVGVKPTYAGIATQVAQLAFGSKLGPWFHMVVVVDDQTDIYDWNEVYHALCTRCNPARGIRVFEHTTGTPLYPHASPHERRYSMGSQVLFDCLWPLDWDPVNDVPRLVSFKHVYPKEIQERVLSNWVSYGYAPVK